MVTPYTFKNINEMEKNCRVLGRPKSNSTPRYILFSVSSQQIMYILMINSNPRVWLIRLLASIFSPWELNQAERSNSGGWLTNDMYNG